METIYKFDVPIADKIKISMPKDARILTFQIQQGKSFIWAICDPKSRQETRCFEIIGTGHWKEGIKGEYIGTVQENSGIFVWHLFEIK